MEIEFLGERVRRTRQQKGLSRELLAERAGISYKYVSEIENGKKNFSISILQRIAETLEVSCDYLIFGK